MQKGKILVMLALPLAALAAQKASIQSGVCRGGAAGIEKITLRLPLPGGAYRLSSGYGVRRHPLDKVQRMHMGVDLACPSGTPIHAAADGVVMFAGRWGSFGKVILLRHRGNVVTLYAHLSRIAHGLRPGVAVRRGDVVALSGATGRVTGPHLHYELVIDGRRVNPLDFCAGALPVRGKKL